jgi:hypothetical protein
MILSEVVRKYQGIKVDEKNCWQREKILEFIELRDFYQCFGEHFSGFGGKNP